MVLPVTPRDVTEAVKTAERIRRWLREHFGEDHSAILGVRHRADRTFSGGFYVVVAAAPSRSIAAGEPKLLGDMARKMASEIPLLGTVSPTGSGIDTVQFESERRDVTDYPEVAFEVRSSGLIELVRKVTPVPADDDSGPTLLLLDILRPVRIISDLVMGPSYARLVRPRHRRPRRKVDWYVGLTPHTQTAYGTDHWADLQFPGRKPGDRSTRARPGCPPLGFAASRLRSSRRQQPLERLVTPVVQDLLVESGYLDIEGAVDDAVKALLAETHLTT